MTSPEKVFSFFLINLTIRSSLYYLYKSPLHSLSRRTFNYVPCWTQPSVKVQRWLEMEIKEKWLWKRLHQPREAVAYYLGRLRKGLITYLGLKTNVSSNKYKKSRYAITNVSMKNISKIIKDFKIYLIRVMCGRVPNMNPVTVTFN